MIRDAPAGILKDKIKIHEKVGGKQNKLGNLEKRNLSMIIRVYMKFNDTDRPPKWYCSVYESKQPKIEEYRINQN